MQLLCPSTQICEWIGFQDGDDGWEIAIAGNSGM